MRVTTRMLRDGEWQERGVVHYVDGFVRHGTGHPVALSLMTLAGPAAEEHHLDVRGIGGVFFAGADSDVEATEHFTPYADLYAFLAVFAPAARTLVRTLWPAVSALADALCARRRLTGEEALGAPAGVIELSLWFTLWSFLGLLVLPTFSRRGVQELDERLRETTPDKSRLEEAVRTLDGLQDDEPERPSFVEAIFHPIPSVNNRIERRERSRLPGCWDAARTAVYLSSAGLGLLGRAVHCNCGRPGLWVFLPTD